MEWRADRIRVLQQKVEEDPDWREVLLQLPTNESIELSGRIWSDQQLDPPWELLESANAGIGVRILDGQESTHPQGKPVISVFSLDNAEVQPKQSLNPLPQYSEQKAEAISEFIDFTYGAPQPKWPLEVFLEISNICDFKCAMCPTFSAINPKRYSNLKNVDRGLLNIADATEPMEEILKHALVVHAFGYGEPTIHPNFREFVDYLSSFEVMIDFFSHGKHLSQEMCDFLVSRKISRITISFSGSTKVDYENIYIGGKFDEILDNLERLNQTKINANSTFPEIHINSIAFNHHIERLSEFVHLMGKRGVDQINIKPLATYDSIPELHAHTSVMREDVEGRMLSDAKEIARQYGLKVESAAYEAQGIRDADVWEALELRHKGGAPVSKDVVDISSFKELAKRKEKIVHKGGKPEDSEKQIASDRFIQNRDVPCFEPMKTFYAGFDGRVFPCCFKRSDAEHLGSLKTDQGIDIWQGREFVDFREKALENRYRADICAVCLKTKAYPKHHSVQGRVGRYRRWFHETFKLTFDNEVCRRAQQLPDNEEILRRRRRCLEVFPVLEKQLDESGIDTTGFSPESELYAYQHRDPQRFSKAMSRFHPEADAIMREEYAKIRKERVRIMLRAKLLGIRKSVLYGVVLSTVALSISNSFIASGKLAIVELSVIFGLVVFVILSRPVKKSPSITANKLLSVLDNYKAPA